MSIIGFIDKLSVQTITYWANPVLDAYGGASYDEPIEIKGRWDDMMKIINNAKGEEIISNSQILTNEELEMGEMVYLGSLEDLDALGITLEAGHTYLTPRQVEGAYKIVAKDKVPLIKSTTKFVRIYYLKPNWETKL